MKSVHEGIMCKKCEFCGKLFTKQNNLNQHIKCVHKGVKYKCDFCPKEFWNHRYVKVHIKSVHEGVREHQCNQCEKTFIELKGLKRHIKIFHQEGENFICKLCGKIFENQIKLTKHVKWIHERVTLEKRKEEFVQKKQKQLKTDGSVVQNVKNSILYKCDHCDKYTSNRLANLKRHVRMVHEGVRDKYCHLCNKYFSEITSLKRHVATQHGVSWEEFAKRQEKAETGNFELIIP